MGTTPTLEVGTKTSHPSRSIKKCFIPTLGGNTKKIFPIGCLKINAPNSCYYLSSIFIAIERHGLCTSYSKRESIGKMDNCLNE
jgi:hypothetical protein